MPDFGAALGALAHTLGPFDIVLPTLPHLHAEVTARAAREESDVDQTLAALSVYTVFLLGDVGAPQGTLSTDR